MADPVVNGGLASYGFGPGTLPQAAVNPLSNVFSGMGRQDGSMGGSMGLPTDFWQSLFGGMTSQPATPSVGDYFNQFFGSTVSPNQTSNMMDPGFLNSLRTVAPQSVVAPPPAYTGPTPIGADPTLWGQSLSGRSTAQGGYSQDPNFWQNMNRIATGTQTFTPWTQTVAPGLRAKPARSGFRGIPVPHENTGGYTTQNLPSNAGLPSGNFGLNVTPTIGNTGIMGTGIPGGSSQITGQTILDYINRRRY